MISGDNRQVHQIAKTIGDLRFQEVLTFVFRLARASRAVKVFSSCVSACSVSSAGASPSSIAFSSGRGIVVSTLELSPVPPQPV